jgi:phospholipase/carboxylesterase
MWTLLVTAALAAPPGWVEVRHHDPGAGAALPTVVVFHGYGATPADIARLYDGYPGPLRVLAPPGPAPVGDGFAWYDVPGQPERFPGDADTERRQRAEELAAALEDLAAADPSACRPLVVGFSQGGMTAFLLAARHPERVSGAIPIGGNLAATLIPAPLAPVVPIRALHGADDARIPADTARATVEALRARGGDATLELFPGVGHQIPEAVRARVWALTAALSAP